MKYGDVLYGPVVVTVHVLIWRWKESATDRYTRASAVSPCAVAIEAAATRPAISAAIVDGEKPDCSSHRSTPNDGPCATTKSAAGLMWSFHSAASPARPDSQAIRIGYADSSS